MKIRPVKTEVFHADGQTDRQTDRQRDRTELIVGFRNFANAPKITLFEIRKNARGLHLL
jgi:hypothetical protein